MGLEDHGHNIIVAYDGVQGERIATTKVFDVIILDVMLPGMNGFELCKRIRNNKIKTPVLMLSSLDSTTDKVAGFDHGADDYLPKPFDFTELLVRIKALNRRYKDTVIEPMICIADLEIDTISKSVYRSKKKIQLTAREYKILEFLAREPGKVFERFEIAQKIWGFSFSTGTNVIDVHINAIRKKIDQEFTPKLIHTVIGIGYSLNDRKP